MWLDPLRPERITHMLGAMVCLLATALSILWSFIWVSSLA
jgi:hypothetical protein